MLNFWGLGERRFNDMKQQCPRCGNWVEGTEKKSLTKRGIKKAIDFIPGVSQFDSAYQLISGESLIDRAIDKVDSQFRNIPYEFNCPNCGYFWESTIDGEDGNLATKEQYIFSQEYEYFVEHSEEIGQSEETLNSYLAKLESIQLTCNFPKSEMCFLIAWIAYMATEEYPNYLSISDKYIRKAIRLFDDQEYHLFALLVDNKQQNRNAEKITREALALFKKLKTDNMLLKEEYYRDELNNAIQETLQFFKSKKLAENNKYLLKNSLWCVPILAFFIYKYVEYEPSGIWLFSWSPVYIVVLLIVGIIYLVKIAKYNEERSRTNEEWLALMSMEFVGFSWKDLFK